MLCLHGVPLEIKDKMFGGGKKFIFLLKFLCCFWGWFVFRDGYGVVGVQCNEAFIVEAK